MSMSMSMSSAPARGIAYRGELSATMRSRMYATASELSGSGIVL
jgi:hypothetical protein